MGTCFWAGFLLLSQNVSGCATGDPLSSMYDLLFLFSFSNFNVVNICRSYSTYFISLFYFISFFRTNGRLNIRVSGKICDREVLHSRMADIYELLSSRNLYIPQKKKKAREIYNGETNLGKQDSCLVMSTIASSDILFAYKCFFF